MSWPTTIWAVLAGRRYGELRSGGALLCVLLSIIGQATLVNEAAMAAPPNIVLILADDLGYGELGCYGQAKIRTPHIDRLASQGLRLTQHYSGAPVCAPARCTLMTGLHTGHAQVRGNYQMGRGQAPPDEVGQFPLAADTITLAKALNDAGYATGAMGKWGLGPVASTGAPNKQGFDLFFGYNCQAVAHSYYPPYLWRNDELLTINHHPIPGHQKQPTGDVRMEDWFDENYSSDLMVTEAVEFVHEHQHEPFFLFLPFIEPHVAMQPPKAIVESYPTEWDDRPYRGQCGYLPHPRPHAGYAAMITALDDHVGKVLASLDELGLTENTLVIFTSDNGTTHAHQSDPNFGVGGVDATFFNSTSGLRGLKGSVHEGGIRVPFVARWPGRIEAGITSDFPCYFPDYFPTLCAIAGATAPADLDGVNLAPLLQDASAPVERKPMVWVFPEYGGQVAVRQGDYKLVRKDLKKKNKGDWELYNIAIDINEANDLAADDPHHVQTLVDILRSQTNDNETFPVEFE